MTRKNLAFLLALLLLLTTLSGCAGQGVGDSSVPSSPSTASTPTGESGNTGTSVEGTFPEGPVVTVDLSTAGWISGNGIIETQNGYYYTRSGLLRYADKSDLSNWVVVCNKPNCKHETQSCTAKGVWFLVEDRLYTNKILNGAENQQVALCSMALDGTDWREEFIIDGASESGNSGSAVSQRAAGNMLCLGFGEMQPNGSIINRVIRVTASGSEVVMENEADDFVTMVTGTYRYYAADALMIESIVYPGSEGKEYHNCRMTATEWEDVSRADQYGDLNGFLFGDYLYRYVPNDGYYVTQLSTGASKRQMDAQLKDAKAYRLTDQWTVETNLRYDAPPPETPELRIFNGSEWKPVQIPEETAGMACRPFAISTEHMFFTFFSFANPTSYEEVYYYITLADETYTLHPVSFTEKE